MAKKFKFNLDAVLRHRARQEEGRLRDFGKATSAVEARKQSLRQIAKERSDSQEDIARMYQEHQPFSAIMERHRYMNVLHLRRNQGERDLLAKAKEMEAKRALLVLARRDRRAMELLRERRLDEHAKQVELEEQASLDALAIQRSLRHRDEPV